MEETRLSLSIMPKRLAVCRLEKNSTIPAWATDNKFFSITRTDDELSIVCPENKVPYDIIVREKLARQLKYWGP